MVCLESENTRLPSGPAAELHLKVYGRVVAGVEARILEMLKLGLWNDGRDLAGVHR